MSWFEANETCRNMGAGLVEINTEEENDQIVHEINRIGYEDRHFWTGLTDLEEEGIFRFESDGSEPVYFNWYEKEPDNIGEADCVRLKSFGNSPLQWKWADFPCTNNKYDPFTLHAICESDRGPTPTASYAATTNSPLTTTTNNNTSSSTAIKGKIISIAHSSYNSPIIIIPF